VEATPFNQSGRNMKQWSRILVLVSLAVVLLIACREGEEVAGITAVPPAHTLMPTETVTETAVPPSTTLTNTPIPTATLPPTETPTPTLTPIPTPTPWPTISLWSTLTPEQSGVNGSFQVVDQIGGRINTVVVQNKIAYVGVGPRLWLLDVSRPEPPVASGQSDILPDLIQHIAVLRDTAYLLTDDESGFWIVDVSQPQLPQILSFFETAVPIDFLREWNGRLYIGPTDDELDTPIFSVDDPHQPTLIGELPYDYYPQENDEFVYAVSEANENEMTISVADATDLNNLRSISEFTIDFDGYFIDADQDQYYFLNW
jgi:hypothetical protein